MSYQNITIPSTGEAISITDNVLNVPDKPIITYIEGDGIGVDITPVMLQIVDTAVKKSLQRNKRNTVDGDICR